MCKGCSHGTLLLFNSPGSRSSTRYYHQDLHRRRLRAGPRPAPSPPPAPPFPPSILQAPARAPATPTKIGTDVSSVRARAQTLPCSTPRPSYSPRPELRFSGTRPPVVALEAGYRPDTRAPSIFRATRFGRRVITHSYADADFHGHRPAVSSEQRLSWYRIGIELGALTPRSVHPAAPVLLTKSGPLGDRPGSKTAEASSTRAAVRKHLKFDNRSRTDIRPEYL